MQKKLKYQLFQLGLGIILWSFVIWYLYNSPSERTAFLAGFKVLVQKVEVMGTKVVNKERGYFLQERLDTITYLQKLVLMYKDYPCQDRVKQLKDLLQDIQDNNLDWYIEHRVDLSSKIQMLEAYFRQCNS